MTRGMLTNLTQVRLKELFYYEPETGDFIRRITRGPFRVGTVAGCEDGNGYIQIGIDGVLYQAHRLVWLYLYGEFPSGCIDHIHGNTGDNRRSELRAVTYSQNQRNAKMRSNNRSGVTGVQRTKSGKWIAIINVNRVVFRSKIFELKEDAVQARRDLECEHGFHPKHGLSQEQRLRVLSKPEFKII